MQNLDNNIKKESFEFVQIDERIFDTKFETKAISYLQDAWHRFKRNRASIVAFIILMFIILMALIAPIASRNDTTTTNLQIVHLPPRVPGLRKLGIFDGTRKFTNVPTTSLGTESYPDGTFRIIRTYQSTTTNAQGQVVTREENDIIVDMYLRAFGERALNNLSEADFNNINPEALISYEVTEQVIQGIVIRTYNVRVNYAKYLGFDSSEDIFFFFGTDSAGRDLWVRLWSGVRVSLLIGVFVAIFNLTIGIVWGSISGYYGGAIDLIMERFVEILSGIPWIAVMTLVVLYLGRNMTAILISLVLTSWIGTAAMVRTQFYRYKGQEYVLAARTLGAKDPRIMVKHIFPNAVGPIVTGSVLVIPSAIFFEATLSYLGLGLQNGVSVGILLANGQAVGITSFPHLTIFPAVVISILMIAFNLFGNGLRDALNPSLRGSE